MSRRRFVEAGAVAAATLALAGCGNQVTETEATLEGDKAIIEGRGEWKPAPCWGNCGGRCANYALVEDGIVLRRKSDDTHEDSPDYPQQRGCLRGRARQQEIFGPERIKYPLKRKNWEPFTGGKKELRGRDEWVRITWDEAIQIVGDELKHAREKYGNNSIFYATNGLTYPVARFLDFTGGFTFTWGTGSQGTFRFTPQKVGYSHGYGETYEASCRMQLRKAETIVLYGCCAAWASPGNPSYILQQAKDNGAEFISVGPSFDASAAVHDCVWIPVRPGTDIAFLLSVAYVLISEDDPETNPLIDWEYLDKYSVGFDGTRMPEWAKHPEENFRDYVMGKYDFPKTPEWASEITGTPPDQIRWFARAVRKDKKVMLLHSFGPGRCNGAESFPQLLMTIGAMLGHMGKDGHQWNSGYNAWCGNSGTRLIKAGSNGIGEIKPSNITENINSCFMWDAILTKKYIMTGNRTTYNPGEERDIDIHVIWHERGSYITTTENTFKAIEAHRAVDFVVCSSYSYRPEAKYADIILPIATPWERDFPITPDGSPDGGNREFVFFPQKILEPLFETKSDRWVTEQLCDYLGFDKNELWPISEKQQHFNTYQGAQVISADGKSFETLVTITQKDIDEWGVEGKPQQGKISLPEIYEKGIYQVKRYEGDPYDSIGFGPFYDDPEANPRPSKSGKFEIYSDWLSDTLNALNYNPNDRIKPYPTYRPVPNDLEATYSDFKNKVKGDYPFQVFNPHYLRRARAGMDQIPWIREAMKSPVFLNAEDCAAKGIKQGDTVLIWNEYGKILRNASVSHRIMPGVVALPHGAWVDVDEETGIDRSGGDNVLTGDVSSVSGVCGYNTNICNYEKYDGEPLPPDWQRRNCILEQED